MEGDFLRAEGVCAVNRFQSTPSVWRVTSKRLVKKKLSDISIHTLRVEGDGVVDAEDLFNEISIHTLRVEGDFKI